MQKIKRPKVIKAQLEKELARYSSRIQKLASKAYQIRTMLEDIAAIEAQQEAAKNALHNTGSEGQTGEGIADTYPGEPYIPSTTNNQEVLGEQPSELRSDRGNTGESAGSGV